MRLLVVMRTSSTATIGNFEVEVRPGLFSGQRAVPCNVAGCYVPGGALCAYRLGADTILAMGGVQGVATMANGLFGLPKADILVGPRSSAAGSAIDPVKQLLSVAMSSLSGLSPTLAWIKQCYRTFYQKSSEACTATCAY